MRKDLRGGGGGYYVRNGIMLPAEGVGAGGGGHCASAGRSGGPRRSGQPPGGMRFQMPGPGSHAGRKFSSACDKKRLDIGAQVNSSPP